MQELRLEYPYGPPLAFWNCECSQPQRQGRMGPGTCEHYHLSLREVHDYEIEDESAIQLPDTDVRCKSE